MGGCILFDDAPVEEPTNDLEDGRPRKRAQKPTTTAVVAPGNTPKTKASARKPAAPKVVIRKPRAKPRKRNLNIGDVISRIKNTGTISRGAKK